MQGGSAAGIALTAYVVISMLENSGNVHVSEYYTYYVFTARRVCIARTIPWQVVCLSVCPLSVHLSIRLPHASILSKRLYISSKFFSPLDSPTILVFPAKRGRRMQDGMEKSRFSTNILLCLGNDAR